MNLFTKYKHIVKEKKSWDGSFKSVFIDMSVVDKHAGYDMAEQMLNIADAYLIWSDLGEQLQSFNIDGQYFGLNIKKSIFLRQRKTFKSKRGLFYLIGIFLTKTYLQTKMLEKSKNRNKGILTKFLRLFNGFSKTLGTENIMKNTYQSAKSLM